MSAATPYRPSSARSLALVAVFAAFIAVLGPLSIPIAGVPVPLSLGPLAIYVTALVLGGIRAFAATSLYVLMGCLGLPIFAQGGSGFGSLAGPTGGYLIGYPFGALAAGMVAYLVVRRRLNPALTVILLAAAAMIGFVTLSTGGLIGLIFNGRMSFEKQLASSYLSRCLIPPKRS
ncbi:substrate-specific component BioY [Rothia aeria]|uniref:Biotin transporter n=1 Tax=Rothia aeria TaxID=172042 RepID=A0A2Z5R0Q6_9MICC|nr:substrate-specific component BioY [Rothia aeria]